jgi:hypothetical protein
MTLRSTCPGAGGRARLRGEEGDLFPPCVEFLNVESTKYPLHADVVKLVLIKQFLPNAQWPTLSKPAQAPRGAPTHWLSFLAGTQ